MGGKKNMKPTTWDRRATVKAVRGGVRIMVACIGMKVLLDRITPRDDRYMGAGEDGKGFATR